jgi:CHAT domain-containing protein/tetratricopeptide repeat protein
MPRRTPGTKRHSEARALRVSVINGDLTFVAEPLLVGHYTSSRLTGTEALLDARLHRAMTKALDLGLYPSDSGSRYVFENTKPNSGNPLRDARPRAVIVVGLGAEGSLTGNALAESVRKGVLEWIQHAVLRGFADSIELAATLLGTGGLGVPVGQAAPFIVQGVLDANQGALKSAWPVVEHLKLVELYLDRATEAWHALRAHQTAVNGTVRVSELVQEGPGALKRTIDARYRGADYDVVSTTLEEEPDGNATILYTLSTKRARSDVVAKSTQVTAVRQMVERESGRIDGDVTVGQRLWELLIPQELDSFLSETDELQLELTRETAGIPWEMLDFRRAGGDAGKPWALRTKLVRKLRMRTPNKRVVDAGADAAVLVIGEPLTTSPAYPPLPAAQREATAVADCLLGSQDGLQLRVESLISPEGVENAGADADTILKALVSRSWRIVHICAHGDEPPILSSSDQSDGRRLLRGPSRGVVLSDGEFLGPREIESLRAAPELVFLNCCHLAKGRTDDVLDASAKGSGRPLVAASIADAFIAAGVRCVVAAGWAVDDELACVFSRSFYTALLKGKRFIDAVTEARQATQAGGGKTWAAYQCYGDPDWCLRAASGDELADIASASDLRLVLDTLATQTAYQGADRSIQSKKLDRLETEFRARWGRIGTVAEAFGNAWSEVGDSERAIRWYEDARAAPDGSASLRASEQLANLRARRAWEATVPFLESYNKAPRTPRAATRRESKKKPNQRTRSRGGTDAARRRLQTQTTSARAALSDAIKLLEQISALGSTAERESLLGSAYKRKAMLESALGEQETMNDALKAMVAHYKQAVQLGVAQRTGTAYYPAMNCLAADLALNAGRRGWKGLDNDVVALATESLQKKNLTDPDFWSLAGEVELAMYTALAAGVLSTRVSDLVDAYGDLWGRVQGTRFWRSVYDQARFVLDPFISRASSTEQTAARELLAYLQQRAAGGTDVQRRPAASGTRAAVLRDPGAGSRKRSSGPQALP